MITLRKSLLTLGAVIAVQFYVNSQTNDSLQVEKQLETVTVTAQKQEENLQ